MRLWIGNLDPNTTDDELREFVAKYSKFQITGIERHPGIFGSSYAWMT